MLSKISAVYFYRKLCFEFFLLLYFYYKYSSIENICILSAYDFLNCHFMIETANLRKLRHLEFCQTIEVICNMLNEREIPEGEVKELVQRLMQELQIFRNHLSYRKTGKLTSELKAIR